MNKYSITILCGFSFAAMLAVAQQEQGSAIFDGGWRISAGGVYDSGVKTKMHFSPRMTAVPGGRLTQAAAKDDGWGKAEGDNVKYVNHRVGKESTLSQDIVYPQEGGGNLDGSYQIPMDTWMSELGYFELGYAEYDNEGDYLTDDRDESGLFGINVELSRNLYHNEYDGWGIDLGFAVQYGRRNKAYRTSSAWGGGGYYRTYYTPDAEVAEMIDDETYSWAFIDNGFAKGMELHCDDLTNPEEPGSNGDITWESGSIVGDSNAFRAEGDYEDLELMLLGHPYYDFDENWRLNGTLGVVVSRQEMDMKFTLNANDFNYRSHRDFHQWDVYGIAGLGLMYYYKDFTLSADFLARFLDNDMDISDRYYRGKVSRGHWMFKLSLGYEF